MPAVTTSMLSIFYPDRDGQAKGKTDGPCASAKSGNGKGSANKGKGSANKGKGHGRGR